MKRFILAVAVMFGLVSTASAADGKFRKHDGGAKDQWIVAFEDGFGGEHAAKGLARSFGARLRYVYTNVLNGFAVEMPEAAALALSRNPHVKYVEQDALVQLTAVQTGTPVTYGLDYIDQRGGYDYSYTYNRTGAGVRIYIIDSGISSLDDFGNRVVNGYTNSYWDAGYYGMQPNFDDAYCDSNYRCHGSKVASIAGGNTYGVAKEATIVNVRVVDYE
ncbi:MAG TPA: S8 family serine peptidase, partial [Thermoanaerobaculia bacterium]|nr:S8 family serine peptidase [Thermoanaerobaculia bacterium]